MKNKTKIPLTAGIIALICLGLLGFAITLGQNPSEWTYVSSSPTIWDYAVGVTATGDSIYIANSRTSDWQSKFMRYNTSTGGWDVLPSPWQSFKNSIAMAWDKNQYIYALPGASYSDIDGGGRFWFFRYDIEGNAWARLQDTPHTNGPGDALCFVPGWALGDDDNFLYAILGSHKPSGSNFYRYNITSDSWSSPLDFPWDKTDDGCSLVWTGNNYLYALRGEYIESSPCYDFWRYNITGDTWESRANITAWPHSGGSGGVGDGGSLLWIGGPYSDYIYALSGNQAYPETPYPIWDKRFYRYTISTNTWESLADLPAGVGDQNGPRLGFAKGSIYCWRGCNKSGDLYEYQLDFSPPEITIISPENDTYYTTSVPLNFTVNEPTSWMGYSLDGQANVTVTGNITLTGLSYASHNIKVYATDFSGNTGSSEKVYFTVTPLKQSPTANFTYSPPQPHTNTTVTFNASSSLPGWNGTHVMPIVSYNWTFGDENTTTTSDPIITHKYTENDTYTVTLNVTDSQGLWNTTSKTITVLLPIHDIAVTNVSIALKTNYCTVPIPNPRSGNIVYNGWLIHVKVTVKNEGTFSENFTVTVYYQNATYTGTIGTPQNVTNLAAGENTTLTIPWRVGLEIKIVYTISANATVVPGETDTGDNTYVDGTVVAHWPGDANGDGKVNVLDLGKMGVAWLSKCGEPNYDPRCDFNGDGIINVIDLGTLGLWWLHEDY